MAYGLKYQSDFYNFHEALCSVKIYKNNYSGAVTSVRTSQVSIESNYKDDNTPVIGTGAKVVIIAASADLSQFEDLLLSYEREFMCTISYKNVVAFRGYSLCDLNERQLLPYAAITVQFTNYVHRLEETYASCLKDISKNTDVFTLVNEFLNLTTLAFPLQINSTLFEENMNKGATDMWITQIRVQNSVFYQNAWDYDNVFAAVNKALQPFSAFLYMYKDNWIIERQEDITRVGNWVTQNQSGATSSPSQRQILNKQDGDFSYVDGSQIIEYDSGLRTLILKLQDKLLDSIVFNNYTPTTTLAMADKFPLAGVLAYRTWYRYNQIPFVDVGENYQGFLNSWVKYIPRTNNAYDEGLGYNFSVQFNTLGESAGTDETATILTISFKKSTDRYLDDVFKVGLRFLLALDGGTYSNYWVKPAQSVSGPVIYLYPRYPSGNYRSADPVTWCSLSQIIDTAGDASTQWSITKTVDLTGTPCVVYGPDGTSYTLFNSLQEAIGFPLYQKFNIFFLPTTFANTDTENPFSHGHVFGPLYGDYLGDVSVLVSAEHIENYIEYYINENFVKTQETELYLFDLPNINYSNGMLEADGLTLTKLWTSENSPTAIPLHEILAKTKFRKYGRTIHRLKGTILCDEILKPFALLSDDRILDKNAAIITFLLNGFTWDLMEGRYEIEAEEYADEDVTVVGVATEEEDSEGNPIEPPPPPGEEVPGQVLNLTASQPTPGGTINVQWSAVTGAVGYIVERMPQWFQDSWYEEYKTVRYSGVSTSFYDDIQEEGGAIPTNRDITYRVKAYNDKGSGEYSTEYTILWNNI